MRVNDWDIQMDKAIKRSKTAEFKWGVSDCFCLVSDVIEAMTGRDPVKQWRGTYNSEISAWKALRKTANDAFDWCDKNFGKRIDVRFAQRGDVVGIIQNQNMIPSLGVVLGRQVICFGESGKIEALDLFNCLENEDMELVSWRIE